MICFACNKQEAIYKGLCDDCAIHLEQAEDDRINEFEEMINDESE